MNMIWERFKIWLEHLFTPHCAECEEAKECKNCIALRLQLEQERAERIKLIELLASNSKLTESDKEIDWDKLPPRNSWKATRQKLERDSYKQAHGDENG